MIYITFVQQLLDHRNTQVNSPEKNTEKIKKKKKKINIYIIFIVTHILLTL